MEFTKSPPKKVARESSLEKFPDSQDFPQTTKETRRHKNLSHETHELREHQDDAQKLRQAVKRDVLPPNSTKDLAPRQEPWLHHNKSHGVCTVWDEILLGRWNQDPEPQRFVVARLGENGVLRFFLRYRSKQNLLIPLRPRQRSEEGLEFSYFADLTHRLTWMEDVRWRLANECPEYLYGYVFAELYQRGRLSPAYCAAAFISGNLTQDTFSVVMGIIVTKVVECGKWTKANRELLRQRFEIAWRDTSDFLTEFTMQAHSNTLSQLSFAQYSLRRALRDLFVAWRVMEQDMSKIIAREYLLEIGDTTGYWRFRGWCQVGFQQQWHLLHTQSGGTGQITQYADTMIPGGMTDSLGV